MIQTSLQKTATRLTPASSPAYIYVYIISNRTLFDTCFNNVARMPPEIRSGSMVDGVAAFAANNAWGSPVPIGAMVAGREGTNGSEKNPVT